MKLLLFFVFSSWTLSVLGWGGGFGHWGRGSYEWFEANTATNSEECETEATAGNVTIIAGRDPNSNSTILDALDLGENFPICQRKSRGSRVGPWRFVNGTVEKIWKRDYSGWGFKG